MTQSHARHYAQVLDHHFDTAVEASSCSRICSQHERAASGRGQLKSGASRRKRQTHALRGKQVGLEGLEPPTKGL